jgi:hypothetical protein
LILASVFSAAQPFSRRADNGGMKANMMLAESVADQPDEDRALAWSSVKLEAEILETFAAPAAPGEQLELAFRRKEHELKVLFDRLSVADARALHRRFTLMLPGDPIASRFGRLISERRARLLAFLADARRREALRHVG